MTREYIVATTNGVDAVRTVVKVDGAAKVAKRKALSKHYGAWKCVGVRRIGKK